MFTKEQRQIKSHNALLADFPIEKRKSREAVVGDLKSVFSQIGYADATERADAAIEVMEIRQLSGGFKPEEILIQWAHGYIDGRYGWFPDLWAEKVAMNFPLRKRVLCPKIMMMMPEKSLYGLPYAIHILGDVDEILGCNVRSTGEVFIEKHNARLTGFPKTARKDLVKALVKAGVLDGLSAAVVRGLEQAQLIGGLEKETLSDACQNRQLVNKIWKVLSRHCPISDVVLVRDFGIKSDVDRLNCPFEIRLGDDGMTVSEEPN